MSKGKWMPGNQPLIGKHKLFHCEPCDRSFTKLPYYEKHKTTELHFKRCSKQACKTYDADPDFFENVHVRGIRACRNSSKASSKSDPSAASAEVRTETHIQCPTCFCRVEKERIGKHLISHYHCQKANSTNRSTNPERNLILDNIHQIVVHSPFQCAKCKYYFTTRSQLSSHFEKNHMKLIPNQRSSAPSTGWNCSACRNVLELDGPAMMVHLKSPGHLKMEATIGKSIPIILKEVFLHECSHCKKKFLLRRELMSHEKVKHSSVENPGEMTNAEVIGSSNSTGRADLNSESLTTYNNTTIRRKLRSKSIPTEISHPCHLCSSGFNSLTALRRHCANCHPRPNGFKCELCGYTTKKQGHFDRHTATHQTFRKKEYKCDECNAAFFYKYGLNYHKKLHADAGKSVPCPHPGCTFLARNQSEITTHNVKHASTGNWPCSVCPYISKSKRHLNRHILVKHATVTNAKFQCKYCEFSTKLQNGLKRHELLHTGQKPFHCPHCPYAGRSVENLRYHVITRPNHPGKHLYNCRLCLKGGTQLRNLFKTNDFNEFQVHVTRGHSDNQLAKSRIGVWLIAGIQVSDTLGKDLPALPQDPLPTMAKDNVTVIVADFNASSDSSMQQGVFLDGTAFPTSNSNLGIGENSYGKEDNFMMSPLISMPIEDIFQVSGKDSLLELSNLEIPASDEI